VDYDRAWGDAWAIKREWVRKTQTLAEDHAARYLMVSASTPQGVLGTAEGLEVLEAAYPAMKEFSWDLDKANHLLGRLCTELSIPLLHLEPIFRERLRETGEALHWQYDGHWTPEGNRLAGDLIAEFILEQIVQTGR